MLGWLNDILNMFFTFLDRIVYGLITILYQLLLYLANLDLFGMAEVASGDMDNPIVNFSSRVYALLGVFMLFKVSFSIIQYMVNPDDFSDKSKGFGKMVTNILISLGLIVLVPYIFQFAFKVQGIVLKENLLGQLILGESTSSSAGTTGSASASSGGDSELSEGFIDSVTNVADSSIGQVAEVFTGESLPANDAVDTEINKQMAEDLQFLVYGAFFSVNTDAEGMSVCSSGPVLGTKAMASNDSCLRAVAELLPDGTDDLQDFFPTEGNQRRFDTFGDVVNTRNGNDEYIFKYMPVISTIAGGFVVVMLLSFCLDVAVRIIKLGFLEIISPIPIISYMDPKQSGKDGMFGRWVKECFSTYLSLFIRIAVIYFAFFVVDLIANRILAGPTDQLYLNGDVPEGLMAVFVMVMVILGVFFFAKEVPKLIEKIFNIQNAGSLHMDRIKGMSLGAAGGLAGFGVGTIASGIAAGKTSLENGENGFNTFRRTLGGAASGGLKAGISSAAAGGKGFMSKSFNAAGDVARSTAMKANTKARYRYGAYIRNAIGAQSLRENLDQRAGVFEKFEKSAGNMEARARDQLGKKYDKWKLVQGLRARNEEQFAQGIINGDQYKANLSDYWKSEQDMINDYINKNGNMGTMGLDTEDLDLQAEKEAFVRNIKENGLDGMTDLNDNFKKNVNEQIKDGKDIQWKNIDAIKKAGHNEAVRIKNSDKYEDATNAEKAKLSDLRQSFLNK